MGYGGVIRDNNQSVVIAYGGNKPGGSIHVSEALALLFGLQTAKSLQLHLNVIKGDSATTIHSIRHSMKCWKSHFYIVQCRKLISPHSALLLIKRECNSLADCLSKVGHQCTQQTTFTSDQLSPDVNTAWQHDKDQCTRTG